MKDNLKDSQNSLPIPKQRTSQQNRALYKFFSLLSEALNDAGLDQRKVLKPSYQIPWTPEAVKLHIWHPLQEAMFGTDSTMYLHKQNQIDLIHKTIMRMLGEKWNLEYVDFPHDPEKAMEKLK